MSVEYPTQAITPASGFFQRIFGIFLKAASNIELFLSRSCRLRSNILVRCLNAVTAMCCPSTGEQSDV